MSSPCLRYYALKDENDFPIPSTMRGLKSVPCDCSLVELPGTVMTVEAGFTQSFHPQGLRYFYRYDCGGQIIPNSLFISKKHPGGNVLEFKKLVADS